jgi:hypothetical protein
MHFSLGTAASTQLTVRDAVTGGGDSNETESASVHGEWSVDDAHVASIDRRQGARRGAVCRVCAFVHSLLYDVRTQAC